MKFMRALLASLIPPLTLVLSTSVGAQTEDHLKCYKITDPLKLEGIVNLDAPELGGLEEGCKISKPMLFCVAATKTVVSATNKNTGLPISLLPIFGSPTDDRVCYKLKCPARPLNAEIKDQFGQRIVSNFRTSMLCTPATYIRGHISTDDCGETFPQCGGACPSGSYCFDHGGNCACSANPPGCTSALAPKCDGEIYNVGGSCQPTSPVCEGGGNSGASCSVDADCPGGMCAQCDQVITNQCEPGVGTPPFGSAPNCIGECTRSGDGDTKAACVEEGGGCQCRSTPEPPPCGDSSAPMCDGYCGTDAACTDVGGNCTCVSRFCGEVLGAPECLGTCLFGVCRTKCEGGTNPGTDCTTDSDCIYGVCGCRCMN